VLISLPRNMANFPFREGSVMDRQFPDGFDCDGCYLNGVSTWAEDHTELFGGSERPGVAATVMAVEGITDLKINYWAMVNLRGFRSLVDAFGGVRLNVRDRIPVGLPHDSFFRYIEPGNRTLDGQETLWFARARYGSDDYSRMARQKCVMNAMLHQISPQSALRNFERIADASSEMVSTDLPSSEVGRFIELALKARSEKISTVSLVPPAVNTGDPDMPEVHRMVRQGIDRSEGDAPAPKVKKKGRPDPSRTGVTGGSLGSMSKGYVANQSDDLGAAC
jgi:LCP family protein required for cell wall assembly